MADFDMKLNIMPLSQLLADGAVLKFRRNWWQPQMWLCCGTKGEFWLYGAEKPSAYTMSRDDVLADDWMEFVAPEKK